MAVDSRHPLYEVFAPMWVKCRDVYAGSDAVKAKREIYLPPNAGMRRDGAATPSGRLTPNTPGWWRYNDYLLRAVFHDVFKEAVEIALGSMYCRPPTIELPAQLESLRTNATSNGETLDMLLRRINEQQLVTGRLGLLADIPTISPEAAPMPYFVVYNAETIINWDDGNRDASNKPRLNFVVLCETEYERDPEFEWSSVEKFRILVLGDPEVNEAPGQRAVARVAIVRRANGESFEPQEYRTITRLGRSFDELPFTIINGRDVVADPTFPTQLGLADLALALYRGEADYRQSLYEQGQDTLVTVGSSEEDHPVGAGASINLKHGGEAYYIGVSGDGLGEMRQCIGNDKAEAAHKAGQLIDNRARPFESGEALKTRQAGQSATLTDIAIAGAYGLELQLKNVARFMGADESRVKVKPNLDFTLAGMMTQELVEMCTAATLGGPISKRSIHTFMAERGMTRLSYEEELREMEADPFVPVGTGTEEGGDEPKPSPSAE